MKLPRRQLISVCAILVLFVCRATAQLYTFSGSIDYSSSGAWTIGEDIKLTFDLTGTPPFQFLPGRFIYSSNSSLRIGGTEYNIGPLPYIGEYHVPGYTGVGGGVTYVGGFASPLGRLTLNFGSVVNAVTQTNGLLKGGLPLSDFEINKGYLYTQDEVQIGGLAPTVTSYTFSSYSVAPSASSPIPEPSTYGLLSCLLLVGVSIARRTARFLTK